MEENTNEKVRPFCNECNNFIDGKYILLGCENINSLLLTILQDPSLSEIVKNCLKDFDYPTQLGVALSVHQTKQKDFIMPKENEGIVALCYNIMQQIAYGEIDFEAFISKYFLFNGQITDCCKNFGHYFILPFRNAMLNLDNIRRYKLNESNGKNIENAKQSDSKQSYDVFKKLKSTADEIEEVIKNDYKIKEFKSEEILFYIKAFREAIKLENKIIILALADAIIFSTTKIKSLQTQIAQLKDFCNELHY